MAAITDKRQGGARMTSLCAAVFLSGVLCLMPALPRLMMPADLAGVCQAPWVLLTYMTVHTGIQHAAANAVCLLLFFVAYGAYSGPLRAIGVFAAGGVAGAIAWLAVGSHGELCGASAGVLALAAASAVARRTRVWDGIVATVLLLSLVASTGSECAAHLAGAAAGGAIAYMAGSRRKSASPEAAASKMRRSGYTSLTAAERRALAGTTDAPRR